MALEILREISRMLSVSREDVPKTLNRLKKELEDMKEQLG